MAYVTDVEPGDVLKIGETRITVMRKNGQKTKLRVDTTENVEKTRSDQPASASPSGILRPDVIGAREGAPAARIPAPA